MALNKRKLDGKHGCYSLIEHFVGFMSFVADGFTHYPEKRGQERERENHKSVTYPNLMVPKEAMNLIFLSAIMKYEILCCETKMKSLVGIQVWLALCSKRKTIETACC